MTSFTRSGLATLRADIDAALKAVGVKHNITLDLGSIRFSASEARCKLTMAPKSYTAAVMPALSNGLDPYNTVESREYVNLAYTLALPKDGLGRKFTSMGATYTIIGLKTSRRKYPVIGISARGTRYKFAASSVKAGLI